MAADRYDIYLIGVGGQGIGLLSEALIRAADYAGMPVRGVDTHGLAQRGGTVISHVRIGSGAHSALIQEGCADMVVALERHEALRALNSHLRDGGTLIYYDAEWQPLAVRIRAEKRVEIETLAEECQLRDIQVHRVFREDLPDARMQNVALLATMARDRLLPMIRTEHYERGLGDLLGGPLLEANLTLFRSIAVQSA